MRFHLLLITLFVLGCTRIVINPDHQACTADSDCTTVKTECNVCECTGQPVNKQYVDYYENELTNLCHGIANCSSSTCTKYSVKCVHDECMIMPSMVARGRS